MDNWNNPNTMITGSDSKKLCCAPLFESFGCFAWFHTESPSDRIFMTSGIDIDQNRNYSVRELCSSSFSGLLIDQNGRRVGSCLPSIGLRMRLGQERNNNKKVCRTEQSILNVYKRHHSTIHQSRLHTATLMSIALIKENLFVNVSMDKRLT